MNIFSWVTMTIKLEGPLPISTLTRERERERERERREEKRRGSQIITKQYQVTHSVGGIFFLI